MNVCGACGLDFGGVSGFDAHRVGVHAYTYSQGLRLEPPREDGRRCLTEHEMEIAVDKRGVNTFARNARGQWSLARSLEFGRRKQLDAREAL